MTVFLTTAALFFSAMIIHVLIWKVRLPLHQLRALMILFFLVLAAWIPFAGLALPGLLHVGLFYISLSLCYVITYSAIEADSPTLSLMLFMHEHNAEGVTETGLQQFLESRPFVRKRLSALIHDGLIVEREGNYFVSGNPSSFFRVILDFRKIYGPISRGG
jgi:hypothetical protein